MILEKFRKKNHQIRSSYEGEIPITKFSSRLKRKDELHVCFSLQDHVREILYESFITHLHHKSSHGALVWRPCLISMHLFFLRIRSWGCSAVGKGLHVFCWRAAFDSHLGHYFFGFKRWIAYLLLVVEPRCHDIIRLRAQ